MLKPWLTFVSEHENWENIRCVGGGEIIRFVFITTKNIKVKFVFIFYLFFLAPDCWCLFTGIVVHQLWPFAFSRKHEVRAGTEEWCVNFFLSNWDGAPLGVGALRKLHTLRIGSGGTVYSYAETLGIKPRPILIWSMHSYIKSTWATMLNLLLKCFNFKHAFNVALDLINSE